ncbi:hypothetical protein FEM48_Zijuj01G0169600 [Ziziphus jujuba var. spinosa]|uniref:Pentatricopeptide repeat-containing protein At4g30700 n=1 Tax=Ziziphus jujuba var. spinosa TaxID=714518 RepID=A0A978W2C7_ZIZJJ|nr:hypothetical protein FEM48_Zijuj01G0165900 [Ziziphus jujuba var. spinosa]KAH7546146.1 hypothetical protein FEM48_Zijuj01G0169600 [Ziziphus jujuba var. spinosa]
MIPASRSRNLLLSLLNNATSVSQLNQTHAQIILHGLQNDLATVTKLTHKLSDLKAIRQAHALFLTTPNPDRFLYNVLIRGFSSNDSPLSSISMYSHLRKKTNLLPDNFTYAFAISAASGFKDDKYGILLHAHSIVDGLASSLFVGSALVDFYFKFSNVELAQKVFDGMIERDTVLWNTMISGLMRNSCYVDSIRTFVDMVAVGMPFDSTTLATVLPAVAELPELQLGMGIQCLGSKVGLHSDAFVLTGLVSMYSKCGEIDTARLLFEQIGQPDLICYNAMIAGYTCNNDIESSVRLFMELLASGERINSSTMVGLIPVSSPFGHLQLASSIQSFCLKSGILTHSSVTTALTTVYCRLNEIESARQLFDESPAKSLPSWNSIISGYTQNGLTETAISLFREMIHAGLVREGDEIFQSMVHDHGFEPLSEHYACMVDIFGRAGQLEKALKFIRNMPVEPGPAVWGALLGACMIHKDRNLARVASERLFELDPENTGYYVLLSNIYSADRNFPKAASVREVVKSRKLAKTPGCTLIEIGETPHVFTAGDRSHPQATSIYAMLEKLTGKMREAGFQTETVASTADEDNNNETILSVER